MTSNCTVKQTLPTLSGPAYPIIVDSQLFATASAFVVANLSIAISFLVPVVAGQYIVLVVQSGSSSGLNVMNTPSGFQKLFGDNVSYGIYVRLVDGTEGSTFTVNGVEGTATIVGIKINGRSAEALAASAESLGTANGPSINIPVAFTLVLSILCRQGGNLSGVVPTGWTDVQHNFTNDGNGTHIYTAIAQINQVIGGPTGIVTWSGTAESIVTLAVQLT